MENLSFVQNNSGEITFSPVYDPTPMRAYSRHNELMPQEMTLGNYGDFDENDNIIGFQDAVHAFAHRLDIKKAQLKDHIDEVLENTRDYTQNIQNLAHLPDENKTNLISIVKKERAEIGKL